MTRVKNIITTNIFLNYYTLIDTLFFFENKTLFLREHYLSYFKIYLLETTVLLIEFEHFLQNKCVR